MKLSTKFIGAVVLLVVAALGGTAWIFIRHQENAANAEVLVRAQTVLSFGQACRAYTGETLRPAVSRHTQTFIPEAHSATFVTRETFKHFRTLMPGYSFREASLNPLNPENRADDTEAKIIARFAADRSLTEEAGYRTHNGAEEFYVARPIAVTGDCLRCHDTPGRAPRELVAKYGAEHGYGWKEGDVTSAIMVTVPAEDIRREHMAVWGQMLAVFGGLTIVLVVLIAFMFRRLVQARLKGAAAVMGAVAADPTTTLRIADAPDEIGAMARSFNRMADSLGSSYALLESRVAERTEQLVEANRLLEGEVAERKSMEESLVVAKEAAEAGSRAKSEFLANMSHEIRTPLNGILGMTELALDTVLTAEQREYLTLAKQSGTALVTVINDILDFSKIEAGKLVLDPVTFSLRASLGDTMKTLAHRAHKQGLELAYYIEPEVADQLVGDAGRLRQIVVNLVSNAIKFTPQGVVDVRVSQEERSQAETVLHFAVHDTGIGIPADKRQLVFNAFEQADTSTTRQYGGTGLGLAIAARLVGMMGGTIWVDSEVGRGSTFHFTARFGISSEPVEPLPGRERLKGLSVLVVDDNAINRRLLLEFLGKWEMRPTAVDGGAAALAALTQAAAAGRPFAVVLLDAMMPGMDGFTVAEHIKQNPRLAAVTVMMLSSAGTWGDDTRCRALGLSAYLTKPVTQSDLLDTLLKALRLSSAKEPAPAALPSSPEEGQPRLRILLVEDNPVNQRLALRLLEKQGHHVTVTANGREALALLFGPEPGVDGPPPFDLVFMDVQMPEMGGFETTALIRAREQGTDRHVPIVAMTAHAMKGDRERCLAAGMDGYVTKPIQIRELLAAVAEHFPQQTCTLER
jgi:signal transduction histidine kinase/CheY-like chemotaxis protein